MTPEGHILVFASALYHHSAPEEIHQRLAEADDFDCDEDLQQDGSFEATWYDPEQVIEPEPVLDGRRVLAMLTVTPEPTTLALLLASSGALVLRRRR